MPNTPDEFGSTRPGDTQDAKSPAADAAPPASRDAPSRPAPPAMAVSAGALAPPVADAAASAPQESAASNAAPPPALADGGESSRPWVPWHRQAGAWVAIGAVVVAALALFVVLFARGGAPRASSNAKASEPGNLALLPEAAKPLGATSDYGIELGQDGVPGGAAADSAIRVDVISDYICPFCQRFAQEVGPDLEEALASGPIRLVVH
ncbi:MAG: hypothetical protein LBO20_02860, partial [Bifidobacteriaceae bacterium]|nr:hypothetical protein [Bifidobacteriaceae bacterium]